MPFYRRILRLYSMDRSPLSDITNAPPTSPTSPSGGSSTSSTGDQENAEPPDEISSEQCKIVSDSRNWKIMDDHLLERAIYSRIPNSPLDAENLRDFYRAKRNGWLDAESPSFLFETLFHIMPTCDLDLYIIRENTFIKALKRYQYSEEQSQSLDFTIALGKW